MSGKRSTLYTRKGDDGTTSLGGGQRLGKEHLRIETIGTVDELSSLLGTLITREISSHPRQVLIRAQHHLFDLGAELAAPPAQRLQPAAVDDLERELDSLDKDLPPLQGFILPGGTPDAAYLHLARAVCRRAERRLCELASREGEGVNGEAIRYLNRLSDLLFVMARAQNAENGVAETLWEGVSR